MRSLILLYRGAYSGLPRAVWWLALVGFINRSGTMVLPFLALYLTQERGFDTAAAGGMLSLYGVGGAIGTLAGGWLCDRLEPNRVQALSLVGAGVGLVALGQVEQTWAIAALLLAVSIVGEAFRPANSIALAAVAPPTDRARVFALRRLAINLGMSFGPAIGGLLAVYDYSYLFWFDGATCIAAALPAWLLARAAAPGAAEARRRAEGGRAPWSDRPFLGLLAMITLLTVVLFQVLSTYPLTLHAQYAMREDRIGLLLAINTLLIVAVEMALVHRLRAADPMRVAAVGALLLCGGLGLTPLGSGFGFAAFAVVVWTWGEMLALPMVEAAVAHRAAGGRSGLYMGLFATTFSIAFILAPAVGSWIYATAGADALWLVVALAGPPIAAGFLALSAPLRRG